MDLIIKLVWSWCVKYKLHDILRYEILKFPAQ